MILLAALQDSDSFASDLSTIGQGVLDYLTPFFLPFLIFSLVATLLSVSAQFGPWRTLAPFGLSLWAVIVACGGSIIAVSVLAGFLTLGLLLGAEPQGFSDFLLFVLSCGVITAFLGAASGVLQWLVFLPNLGHVSAIRWVFGNVLFWSISYPLSLLLAAGFSLFMRDDIIDPMMVVFGIVYGCILGVKIGGLAAEHTPPESKGAAEWLVLAVAGRWLFALYLALLLLAVVAPMYGSVSAGMAYQHRVNAAAEQRSQVATAQRAPIDATAKAEVEATREHAIQADMTAVALAELLTPPLMAIPVGTEVATSADAQPHTDDYVTRLREEGFEFCGSKLKLRKRNTYVCVKHEPHNGTSWDLAPVIMEGDRPMEVFLSEDDDTVGVRVLRPEVNAYTTFNFRALPGEVLTTHGYVRALGEPIDGVPFLGINLDGKTLPCARSFGRYDLLDMKYDPRTRAIQSLAVDFALYCGDGSSSIFGVIRYNSRVPL